MHVSVVREPSLDELRRRVESLEQRAESENLVSLVLSCSDQRAVSHALLVAATTRALDMRVNMFFVSLGVCMLRDAQKRRSWWRRWRKRRAPVVPGLSGALAAGADLDFDEFLSQCSQLGVRLYACGDSCALHGVTPSVLAKYETLETGGLTSFLDEASRGKLTLWI